MGLFTHGYGNAVLEVGASNPGHDTIVVGGLSHPTRQLARYSPPKMPYIVNLFKDSFCGGGSWKLTFY